ncbi:hypothetical protein OIU77_008753 [Salix suchowensis]|uniref:Uncharacterized protein n=1 Tax=Salix suchowensis TaxID=1278906 RepID=A0ABQ9AC05_9ROSI|nr:hypothetical protein OIU77_008753 [Salix suchowensis]
MVENDQDADIESGTNVLTDHYREPVEDNGFQQPSTEHTGMFQSNPGLAKDARVVTHNMVGNGHDVGRMFQLIITGSADYVNFATSYGLGQELVEDNGFQQPSTEHTGMFQSNPGLAKDVRVVTQYGGEWP